MSSLDRGLATGLNFVIWSAGYLYRQDRTIMGGLLLAGYLVIHWYWITDVGVVQALTGGSVLIFASHPLLPAGLAYDAYTTPGINERG